MFHFCALAWPVVKSPEHQQAGTWIRSSTPLGQPNTLIVRMEVVDFGRVTRNFMKTSINQGMEGGVRWEAVGLSMSLDVSVELGGGDNTWKQK